MNSFQKENGMSTELLVSSQWFPSDKKYFSEVRVITPDLAKLLLAHHNASNRTVRKVRVNFYAEEIARNKWRNSSGAIGFDKNQQLTNGQHRLMAVVEAGIPISIPVVFNCDTDSRISEDCGLFRSTEDRLTLSSHGISVDSRAAAALRLIVGGPNGIDGRRIHIDDLAECWKEWSLEIEKATKILSGTDFYSSVGIALCSRALRYLPESTIAEFFRVADTGEMIAPDQLAANTFGRWHIENRILRNRGGKCRKQYYLSMQQCLAAFGEGKQLKLVRPVDKDLFPERPRGDVCLVP